MSSKPSDAPYSLVLNMLGGMAGESKWTGEPQTEFALELPARLTIRVEEYAEQNGITVATALKCLITAGLNAEAEAARALAAERRD